MFSYLQVLQVWHGYTTLAAPENYLGVLKIVFDIDLDQIPPALN